MDVKELVEKLYESSSSEEIFLSKLEGLKRKASKGLIEFSDIEIEKAGKEVLREENLDEDAIVESVLDPVRKTRPKEIFDDNENMRDEVRKQILELAKSYKESMNEPFEYRHIYMIGSSTSFNYSDSSDIDINAITTIPAENWREAREKAPKGILLNGTQKPINFFTLYAGEEYNNDNAENIYDIIENKWIKKVGPDSTKLPYSYLLGLSKFFMDGCDLSISQYKRDKQDYEISARLNPKEDDISQSELVNELTNRINRLKNDVDRIRLAHHIVYSFSTEGFKNIDNRFRINIEMPKQSDPRFSANSVIYKIMDRFGYLETLVDLEKEGRKFIQDAENHIKEISDDDRGGKR